MDWCGWCGADAADGIPVFFDQGLKSAGHLTKRRLSHSVELFHFQAGWKKPQSRKGQRFSPPKIVLALVTIGHNVNKDNHVVLMHVPVRAEPCNVR